MKVITDRKYTHIVLHCSDSDRLAHDNIEVVKEWHLGRGFDDVGYHYLITKTRGTEVGRDITEIGAHVKGHNRYTIGVCLTGRNSFTNGQFEATASLIYELMQTFNIKLSNVIGHNELDMRKKCPVFNVNKEIIPKIKEMILYSNQGGE